MYDALGRETRRESAAGFRLSQAHDKIGQLTRQWAGKALRDPLARASQQRGGGAPAGMALERTYGWNRFFEPTSIADSRWGETTYTYNVNGQINETRFGDGPGERFRYDPAMNIAAKGVLDGPQARGPGSSDPDIGRTFTTYTKGLRV